MEHTNTGPVSAEEFRAWAAVPGVMLVVGSREEVIRWSNTAFAESFGFSVEEMDGKRYDSYLPEAVLVERRQIWKPMLDRGERVEYSQLIHDRRMRTLTAPLDPEVMGPDAIVFGFFPEGELNSTPNMPIAAHSVLHEFAVLSPAELRVLHAEPPADVVGQRGAGPRADAGAQPRGHERSPRQFRRRDEAQLILADERRRARHGADRRLHDDLVRSDRGRVDLAVEHHRDRGQALRGRRVRGREQRRDGQARGRAAVVGTCCQQCGGDEEVAIGLWSHGAQQPTPGEKKGYRPARGIASGPLMPRDARVALAIRRSHLSAGPPGRSAQASARRTAAARPRGRHAGGRARGTRRPLMRDGQRRYFGTSAVANASRPTATPSSCASAIACSRATPATK